jgi:hypothetical protein
VTPRILLAATVAAALLTACTSAQVTRPARDVTRQVHVAPVGPGGTVAGGFRVTKVAGQAACEPGSEAIGQAYRCFAGNAVYDPCWAEKAARPTVLCLPEPWSGSATRLSVSGPLGAIPPQPGGTSEPWGVELTGGQRCILLQGAHSAFDGQVIEYYCGPQLSLLRGLVRTAPLWHVHSVVDKAGHQTAGPVQMVTIAWFGTADSVP